MWELWILSYDDVIDDYDGSRWVEILVACSSCMQHINPVSNALTDWLLYSHCRALVSFQIYDFDGDGLLSPGDLTAVVAATLREQKIVVTRADLDVIVRRTIDEANPAIEDMISLDE